jgi:histidinol phosphatase-like enzyme
MEKPIVVVDIDGTILTNHKRLIASARDIIGSEWPFTTEPTSDAVITYIEDFPRHSTSSRMRFKDSALSPIESFYQVFLSNKYLSLDEPIVGALAAILEMSIIYRIVFLTGRHDGSESMKRGTLSWLHSHGVKTPEIMFKPNLDVCNSEELRRRDEEFKLKALEKLKGQGRIIAVIGDAMSDIRAAVNMDLVPLWFGTQDHKIDKKLMRSLGASLHPPIMVNSWDEIGEIVAFLNGDDSKMRPIVDMYVLSYTSFLSSLDHITYLCLITSTVALGFMYNSRQEKPMSLLITALSLCAIWFLFMAVVSCIFAFIPRTSHPPKAGAWIIFSDIRRTFSRLRGVVTDAENTRRMDEGMSRDKRALFANFIEGVYKTTDPTAILCQRYFDLRLANYSKIRWISWGAVFLLLGLTCIVVSLLCQLVSHFFMTPAI